MGWAVPSESSWAQIIWGEERGVHRQHTEGCFLGKDGRRGRLVITKYEMYVLCNDSGASASLYSAVLEIA